MYFEHYELEQALNGNIVHLYIRSNYAFEEFIEEFGLTKNTKEELERLAIEFVKQKFTNKYINTIKIKISNVLISTLENNLKQLDQNHTNFITEEDVKTLHPVLEFTRANTLEESLTVENISFDDVSINEFGPLPGDFFYFVENVAEKLQLAFIFEDTAKSHIFSEIANETISKFNELFELGDTEGAINKVKESLKSDNLSLFSLNHSEENNIALDSGPALPESGNIPEDVALEDHLDFDPEEQADDDVESVKDVKEELQDQFSNNMTKALLAMEMMTHPEAKKKLIKYVDQFFEKMEKKLGKMVYIEDFVTGSIPVADEIGNL